MPVGLEKSGGMKRIVFDNIVEKEISELAKSILFPQIFWLVTNTC